MPEISRAAYADLFGPTTGDRIRLADTDLIVEIEEDRSGGPGLAGDEAVVGGGTGPAEGSKATTVTPGPWHLARMMEAMEQYPLNIGFLGKGNTVSHDAMLSQIRGGALGLKLHEDWGSTPAVIDASLTVAD